MRYLDHLDDVELVDGLDGSLPAERAAHLGGCGACRERLDSLRQTVAAMGRSSEDDIPEPSPLFWEHFSRRVHEAVREVNQPSAVSRPFYFRPAIVGWVAAGAVVAIAAAALWTQTMSQRPTTPPATAMADSPSAPAAELDWNIDDDEEWALVRVVAADLHWDEAQAAGLQARPGSAERVALEMSADERKELARLIEFEMKRPGA
jgi:hypothetical protein